MAKTINLTDRDIDYISRVVDTEVPRSIQRKDPQVYRDMVRAVVDTVTNRLASDGYPNTVEGVLNERRQFSKITGPSSLDPYGSVKKTPAASQVTQDLVREHIGNRVAGGPSTIGDAVNYANPNFSSASNLSGWVNPMIEAGAKKLGLGNAIHWHGNAPNAIPADEYGVALNGLDNTNALANPAVPEERPEAWASAVPGTVQRGLLSDVPQDLQSPAVTPTEAYGLLSQTMGQTPSLNLSGATPGSFRADNMVSGVSANGLDGLRSGLLSSGSVRSPEAELAEMQAQANLQNEVNMARQRVSQPHVSTAYQPDQQVQANNGVTAIEAISPTAQQAQPRGLADAYAQLGTSLDQGGILGLSGMKQYDPNKPMGELSNPNPLDSLPAYEPNTVQTASIEGPVSTDIAAPEDTVEQGQVTGAVGEKAPSRFGTAARNFGVSALGGLAGSTLGGPVGGLIGSVLAREAFGAKNPQGEGLLGGGALSGLLGGLTGGSSGQGAWGGVGALNNIGSGAQASYGAWGGPKGTTAMATDGSRITNLGNGLVSRISKNGVETLFRGNQTYGGGGGISGGFFGGLLGKSSGEGGGSQADRARDSVGLY